MSTYINPNSGKTLRIDQLDAPSFLREYLNYELVIRNLAPRTVNSYYIHIRGFFRWIKTRYDPSPADSFNDVMIGDVTFEQIEDIKKDDVFEYLSFLNSVMDNGAETRSAKLTALKSMYAYFHDNGRLDENPVENIKAPKQTHSLPKYLSKDESITLLSAVTGTMIERDYCIITLFVNCGMRISELVGIEMKDIRNDSLRIYGKGRKERMLYLNDACIAALDDWLRERAKIAPLIDEDALWVSKRTGKRITTRAVQKVVSRTLLNAGLSDKGYSAHKLRHTAATLMYQEGNADILELKELLGHSSTATTEIYTHVDKQQLKSVVQNSPLSQIRRETGTQVPK